MVNTWDITIPQFTGDETRKVYLYLPESYTYEPERHYPVLYMFDGHNVFFDSHATYGKSWGMKEYMDRTGTQLIIVAVECNHSPDFGRLKEYSPYPFSDPQFGKITAKGDLTMDWLVNTLKPDIDRHYRTLSDREHTFIAGSSMGGLMSLYAVTAYNVVFSRCAALSPSVWVASGKISHTIAAKKYLPDTVVYLDYGSEEFTNHPNMQRQFLKTAEELFNQHVYVDCRIIPGGTHCEASWERQIPFFMNTLLYQY